MPKRVTRDWLSRMAWGLTSGALALSVLTAAGGSASIHGVRSALAEDLDCYNDKDLYNLPECVERRNLDKKGGMDQNEAQGAGNQNTEQSGGEQQSGGGSPPGGGNQPSANNPPSGGGQQQASGGGQQQQSSPPPAAANDDDDDDKPAVRTAATDPKQVVLQIGDAGKEATQYLSEEGSDKYGPWARTRFERDRSNGASALGPNVMDSKVWITKDVESAKALFKEQVAIKSFPERKEEVKGPVEKVKPTPFGEEFAFTAGYYQDPDSKLYHHYRIVMRQGKNVAVVYLFGRGDFFQDRKEETWTGEGNWYYQAVFERM
jgi:hypothetical protein